MLANFDLPPKTLTFTFQSGYIQINGENLEFSSIKIFTFQSGYIQIRPAETQRRVHYKLYIPIWLYSNCYNCSRNINNMHFTFQSGYIQITTGRLWPHSTQALHSNLVIFKLRMLAITRELSTFTFQSGYIQIFPIKIYLYLLFPLHSNLVIFK